MAWTYFWIFTIALTTTSAYVHPHHSRHFTNQNYKALVSSTDDHSVSQSVELGTNFGDDEEVLQDQKPGERTQDIHQNHDSREVFEWGPKIPVGKSNPFRYYQTRLNKSEKNPLVRNVNWDFVFKNLKGLTKTKIADSDEVLYRYERRNIFKPLLTEECEERGYCENSPDYPHEYVEALLAKLPQKDTIFNMDTEPEIEEEGHLEDQVIQLCKSDSVVIKPDKVKTNTGKWVFVINGRHNKVQGFIKTKCRNKGGACANSVQYEPNYNATCTQKYRNQTMWGLGDSGELIQVTQKICSCCTCELYKLDKSYF